jgi:hypothetical protein
MKIEHQSPGSFEYTCKKEYDCYFCDVMNRPTRTDDEALRKNGWTPNEIKYLIENYEKQPINATAKALNKSRGAIFTQIYNLRKTMVIKSPARTPVAYGQQMKSKPNINRTRWSDY